LCFSIQRTIRFVRYSDSEPFGAFRRTSDNELPLARLTCKISGVKLEHNRSVSETVQPGREVRHVWCTNIFADHPPRRASADHGKEESGEVGMLRFALASRVTTDLAWVPASDNVDSGQCSRDGLPNVSDSENVRPVLAENGAGIGIDLDLPSDFRSCSLEAKAETSDSCKEITDSHGDSAWDGQDRFSACQ
jgi:hypothetical protein